jgi:hypothetical protein
MENVIQCECGKNVKSREMYRHKLTKKHLLFCEKGEINKNVDLEKNDENDENGENIIYENNIVENNNMDDLENNIVENNYYDKIKPNNIVENDEYDENNICGEIGVIPKKAVLPVFTDDELYSENPPELIGGCHNLIHKIKSYKATFPEELKKIKIKSKGITKEYLESVLLEIDIILSCGNIETLFLESLFQFIQISEGLASQFEGFNFSGLAEKLRNTPQFLKLAKQLMLKHGSVASMPPEFQISMIVLSTGYFQIQQNNNIAYLNSS